MISYNGIRFDDATHVRWAIFLDALRVPYIYDRPDFRLSDPNGRSLIVDAHGMDKAARRMAAERCRETRQGVYLFSGAPWFNSAVEFFVCTDPLAGQEIGSREDYGWCQCPVCGMLDIGCQRNPFSPFMGQHAECPDLVEYADARSFAAMELAPAVDIDWTVVSPSIVMAFCAAKSDFQDASFPAILESIRDAIDLLRQARVFASTHVQAQWDAACNRATRVRALERAKTLQMRPKTDPGGAIQ